MKKILFLSFVILFTIFISPMTASASSSTQNVKPIKALNPVEKDLSKETRTFIALVLKSKTSNVSYTVSSRKKMNRVLYEFRCFVCSKNVLSSCVKKENHVKSYVIYSNQISFLKKRIKRVRKVDNYYYKVAKRLYHGKNKYTVRCIARYIKNHLSYKSSKRNLYKNNRRGNCVVYCQMFYLLCQMNHIPTKIYYGCTKKYAHCWNRVMIGRKWYWCDICWYDTSHRSKYILSQGFWSDHDIYRRHLTGKYILNMY